MLQKIETTAAAVVLGIVPVTGCFLAGWWLSIPLVSEAYIMLCALAGLLVGVLVDVFFLRNWLRRAGTMRTWVWMAVYVFYSIGLFGFFMGVPVFNVALGLPAGFFVGRRLARASAGPEKMQRAARQAAVFTTAILGVACVASAWIALASPSTASDLEGMLSLPFPVTPVMILALILAGGAAILALEWWLTVVSVQRAYRIDALNM